MVTALASLSPKVGIDDALLGKNAREEAAEPEIIEMMNGCICCTVRSDLIAVLQKLAARVRAGELRLDGILIETTGLADPAPVAQTFFVDYSVKAFARLDGIVTLVDARHIEQHLDEEKPEGAENEAVEQVAFADRILLNKTDLVSEADLERARRRGAAADRSRGRAADASPDSRSGRWRSGSSRSTRRRPSSAAPRRRCRPTGSSTSAPST